MKKPTSAQLKQLERDNARYPETLQEIPPTEWPAHLLCGFGKDIPRAAWRSRRYHVTLWEQAKGGIFRLSITRTDFDRGRRFRDNITWDDLQRLKAEAGFGETCAVEIYPPDSRKVDVANMRHLFLMRECPGFVW